MAISNRLRSLRLVEPVPDTMPPMPGGVGDGSSTIDLGTNLDIPRDIKSGVETIENGDGSATFDFNPQTSSKDQLEGGHFENLANRIEEGELARIASELIDGISRDDQSRQEWLQTRARGIELLGLKLEEPRGDIGASSAPLEGMSTVRHPLLLDSVLRFHANARGELLPAAGPVKIRNDATSRPEKPKPAPPPPPPMPPPGAAPPQTGAPPGMGHNGGPPMGGPPPPMGPMQAPGPNPQAPPGMGAMPMPSPGPAPVSGPGMPPPGPPMPPPMMPPPVGFANAGEQVGMTQDNEELAEALEQDINHYLTSTAKEYYPDTDRMLFWVGAGGQGIKKVFNCPLKRRPVSESVDAENLIVSNATTNLENCGRITHRIMMRPSTLKRMQIIGAYRDVEISPQSVPAKENVVDKTKASIQGVKTTNQKPEEQDHEIYETYCELNIQGFEHKSKKGKPSGLQCPYKVVVHVASRKILEIRRNWEEGDALCMPKQYFVDFAFVRALGFYGIGLIHIAGNTTSALTAAWREMLDAGMFASFPGFLYSKPVGRQLSNQFRVPPGGGIGLDIGVGKLSDNVMPLPYKEPGAGFQAFIKDIAETGARVAGSADVPVGEGTQEIPVGTTIALIEQATKVIDAVHKRLHMAQATEFQLLKQRFKEDPEAFWRHNKKPAIQWRKEQFLLALENNDLVPVADPNNPTSLHRIAKATAIKTLQQASPELYDAMAVDKRIFRIVGIDPDGLFKETPTEQPPDPRLLAVMQKAEASKQQSQVKGQEIALKAATTQQQWQHAEQERASRERVEEMKILGERMRLQQEELIHQKDMIRDEISTQNELERQQQKHFLEIAREHAKALHDIGVTKTNHASELFKGQNEHTQEVLTKQQKHEQEMEHTRQKHEADLEQTKKLGEAKVAAARAMARAKPKAKK